MKTKTLLRSFLSKWKASTTLKKEELYTNKLKNSKMAQLRYAKVCHINGEGGGGLSLINPSLIFSHHIKWAHFLHNN